MWGGGGGGGEWLGRLCTQILYRPQGAHAIVWAWHPACLRLVQEIPYSSVALRSLADLLKGSTINEVIITYGMATIHQSALDFCSSRSIGISLSIQFD